MDFFRKKLKQTAFPAPETTRKKWIRQLAERRLSKRAAGATLMAEPEATLLQLVESYIELRKQGYQPDAALAIIHRHDEPRFDGRSRPGIAKLPPEPCSLSSYANYLLGVVHVRHGGLDADQIDDVLREYLDAYKRRGSCEGIQKSMSSDRSKQREQRLPFTKKIETAGIGSWRTKIECHHCGQRIGIRTADLGRSAPCPNCKTTLDIRAITQRCVEMRQSTLCPSNKPLAILSESI
ncbi:MAG: hypothetical protein ACI9MB_003978 [Verrucomicrobiales bacterium]|jgi:hypothetical protein